MLKIEFTNQFKKDYKLAVKRGCNPLELEEVINLLANQKKLPDRYKDHALTNTKDYKNVRECHINPDWLLIYKTFDECLILRLIRTGSHSDLF